MNICVYNHAQGRAIIYFVMTQRKVPPAVRLYILFSLNKAATISDTKSLWMKSEYILTFEFDLIIVLAFFTATILFKDIVYQFDNYFTIRNRMSSKMHTFESHICTISNV